MGYLEGVHVLEIKTHGFEQSSSPVENHDSYFQRSVSHKKCSFKIVPGIVPKTNGRAIFNQHISRP